MSRPDEGLIHTWLDGECSAEEAAQVERLVATDPAWAAAVAEARGLLAASSRIVSALDAVPAGVIPEGSVAAPARVPGTPLPVSATRDGFRVRPWMQMAAGLVLVAGTAFAIRTSTREVFAPATSSAVDASASASTGAATPISTPDTQASGAGARSGEESRSERATRAAKSANAPSAGEQSAPAGKLVAVPTPSPAPVPAPAPAPASAPASAAAVATAAPSAPEKRLAPTQDLARRLGERQGPLNQIVTTGTRGAEPEILLDSPNSLAAVARLDGCWTITAPDSLRTVLRFPEYTRGNADTLMVAFVLGRNRIVAVTQRGDALRGDITAERVECAKP